MAFTNNKDQVKKKNYNVFLALDNKSIVDIETLYTTPNWEFLSNFPSSPTEVIAVGDYTITNNSEDVIVLLGAGNIINNSTDGKLRFVVESTTGACDGYTGDPTPIFRNLMPLGVCLAEAELKEEKGEDIKLLDGNFHIVEKNISYNVIMPRSDMEFRKFLVDNGFLDNKNIGILFKEIIDKEYAYINNAPFFAGQTIKANALGQMTLSGNYSVSPETIVMSLG